MIESFPKKYRFIDASTCTGVVKALSVEQIDYTILDMHLEEGNIFSTISRFADYCNRTRVLIYSMNSEKVYASRLIRKGIKGYVSKLSPVEELKTAIRTLPGHIRPTNW